MIYLILYLYTHFNKNIFECKYNCWHVKMIVQVYTKMWITNEKSNARNVGYRAHKPEIYSISTDYLGSMLHNLYI